MAVTVADVRFQLNDISEEEISTNTIELEIQSAERKASGLGMTLTDDASEEFIRRRAAYYSFIQSELYTRIEIHDLQVQRSIKDKLNALKAAMDESLEDALGDEYDIDSTPMFDNRPEDDGENSHCNWPRTR